MNDSYSILDDEISQDDMQAMIEDRCKGVLPRLYGEDFDEGRYPHAEALRGYSPKGHADKQGLFLFGPSGSGKTFFAAQAAMRMSTERAVGKYIVTMPSVDCSTGEETEKTVIHGFHRWLAILEQANMPPILWVPCSELRAMASKLTVLEGTLERWRYAQKAGVPILIDDITQGNSEAFTVMAYTLIEVMTNEQWKNVIITAQCMGKELIKRWGNSHAAEAFARRVDDYFLAVQFTK